MLAYRMFNVQEQEAVVAPCPRLQAWRPARVLRGVVPILCRCCCFPAALWPCAANPTESNAPCWAPWATAAQSFTQLRSTTSVCPFEEPQVRESCGVVCEMLWFASERKGVTAADTTTSEVFFFWPMWLQDSCCYRWSELSLCIFKDLPRLLEIMLHKT